MPARRFSCISLRGCCLLGLAVVAPNIARAQDSITVPAPAANGWQNYNWLAPSDPGASGAKIQATATQDVRDPFTTVSTGALNQEKYGAAYTRQIADMLTLSCETSAVVMSDDSQELSNGQRVGVQFQPAQILTLRCDAHAANVDATLPANSTTTTGAAVSAETHLPLNNGTLSVGANSDRTSADVPNAVVSDTNAYDVQYNQPLGKLPVAAVVKGHYAGTLTGGAAPTSLPSLEQSLVWKPVADTTLQAGLRQQQYQEYPGVDHQLNEALFADWSQQVIDNVSWHSYAEVLNSRGLLDQAPASAISSGANGTAQENNPVNSGSVTSSLPISVDDQTLTFSTGPSFRLEKDISASVEYSNRWDKNPAAGSLGEEQRVSVSLKGTF